jgi:heme oxygenase
MSVVHSVSDLNNIKNNFFPKLYVNLLDRVRVVDNPSEIIYVAAALDERLADRASQARLDALNPSPLLPTPAGGAATGNDDDD